VKQIANGRSREANMREATDAIMISLDAARDGVGHNAANDIRANQIGSGMRGDKRRTYRFQDDSIHDHDTGRKTSCKRFMRGDIETLW
jgi:peptide chain release factor 1